MVKKRILTGDRPTGRLHLGHYIGSLQNRVKMQKDYDTFIIIADVQALTTNWDNPDKLAHDVREVAKDNLAAGIDPENATLFVQSMVPSIAELTVFYSMFVSVNVLRHNPTIKTEAAQHGFTDMTYGFLGYPVSQAADITFCKAHLVPIGKDNVPHVELTRKIVRRFNQLYGEVLVEPEMAVQETLVGLDGNAKMSKSLDNAIYLTDSPEEVARKIRVAITDPARIYKDYPGHPEVCTVFTYHQQFSGEFVSELEPACRRGVIGCVECKKRLTDCINALLDPIRERRAFYDAHPDIVDDILQAGTAKAIEVGAETLAQVKDAMKISYFDKQGAPNVECTLS
ncbi:MAG TPA: tryptophan--tRNA ligase [Armatimonadota bacterium]|nr:tryptophan--tRNA ligase [Armatimonadota bacterium]